MNSWASSCLPYPRWLPILRIRESMLIGEKGIWFPLAFWTCFWSSHMKHQSRFIPGEQNNSVHAQWGREGALLVLNMISHLKQLISSMSFVATKPDWGDWGKPIENLQDFPWPPSRKKAVRGRMWYRLCSTTLAKQLQKHIRKHLSTHHCTLSKLIMQDNSSMQQSNKDTLKTTAYSISYYYKSRFMKFQECGKTW